LFANIFNMIKSKNFFLSRASSHLFVLCGVMAFSSIVPTFADNLGQSEWITPDQNAQQSQNLQTPETNGAQASQLGQSEWQQPQQAQSQPSQLGQSEWQQPQQAQSQASQLGQSQWQQPQEAQSQGSQLGQSQWQQPQQAQSQASQLGQSDWQKPQEAQSQASRPAQSQWQQGTAQVNQLGQSDWQTPQPAQASAANQYQYQEPGAYLNSGAQTTNTFNTAPNQTANNAPPVNGHVHKDKNHPGLLSVVGGLGKAVGVGVGATAPLAGAYLMGRAMNPYGAMPFGGMGMNPYSMMRPGYGYGGMPYGGMSSFMHY
jgi:hypothetical protein